MLYHKDIYWPESAARPLGGLPLRYGGHATGRAQKLGVSLPATLPERFELIEVELDQGEVQKWVTRFPWTTNDDLVMVVKPNGFVKTVWLNHKDDKHCTLRCRRYQNESGTESQVA